MQTQKTGDNGNFVFENLCLGTYNLIFGKDGYKTQDFSIVLNCENSLEFTKTLLAYTPDSCCKGVIKVAVKDSKTGDIINGAQVKLWQNGVLKKTLNTENGYVIFTELCKGAYSFDIFA